MQTILVRKSVRLGGRRRGLPHASVRRPGIHPRCLLYTSQPCRCGRILADSIRPHLSTRSRPHPSPARNSHPADNQPPRWRGAGNPADVYKRQSSSVYRSGSTETVPPDAFPDAVPVIPPEPAPSEEAFPPRLQPARATANVRSSAAPICFRIRIKKPSRHNSSRSDASLPQEMVRFPLRQRSSSRNAFCAAGDFRLSLIHI